MNRMKIYLVFKIKTTFKTYLIRCLIKLGLILEEKNYNQYICLCLESEFDSRVIGESIQKSMDQAFDEFIVSKLFR